MNEIDTTNKFLVGVQGESIVIFSPPGGMIARKDALNLAAWLVVLASEDSEEFDEIRRAIENT